MSLVLIDTSIWIDTLRRNPVEETVVRVEQLLMDRRAAWCGMVELELWSGVGDARERKMLASLSSVVQALATPPEVWSLACQVAAQARSAGLTAPASDYLIFACSKHFGAELYHRDKHFEALGKL